MNEYEATVVLKVNIAAFSEADARDAIEEDLQDLPGGAAVTELKFESVREL